MVGRAASAAQGGVMSTLAERLNNAIGAIAWAAPAQPAGNRQAIEDLQTRWLVFWNSAERRMLPELAIAGRLQLFAESYAKAYVLVPPEVRAKVPSPASVDATAWASVEDQLRQSVEGGSASAEVLSKEVRELATEAGELAGKAGSLATRGLLIAVVVVGVVGVVATVVLVAFANAKRA